MDWIQQWQSKLNKQNGVAPLVRTGGSRHTGLAALPYRNIHIRFTEELDSKLHALAKGEHISFNELVLRCCQYALDNYEGNVAFTTEEKATND